MFDTDQPLIREAPRKRWLDLRTLAHIEVSSEDELFPIERAFTAEPSLGWRAARPGVQVIRLVFHRPQAVQHIRLHFIERASERSQEIVLRTMCEGETARELLRQQFNFSPAGSTEEIEEFTANLQNLLALELEIDPDRANAGVRSDVYATLVSMRLSEAPEPSQ